jgi:hypothetical protein
MKNKYLLTLAKCLQLASMSVLVFAVFIPATGAAQATHQVAGKWKMTVSGSYEFELQLRQSGQDFEGTMRRTNGTEPTDAVSGTVGTDSSIKFTRSRAPKQWRQTYTGNINVRSGTLHMNGDWAHDGKPSGKWEAEQTERISPKFPFDITGQWSLTVSGSYEFSLVLKQNGQDVNGTMKRTNGNEPIDPVSGTVQEDGSIQFERCRGAKEWIQRYTGRIDFAGAPLRITGNWSHLGSHSSGSWVATKR